MKFDDAHSMLTDLVSTIDYHLYTALFLLGDDDALVDDLFQIIHNYIDIEIPEEEHD